MISDWGDFQTVLAITRHGSLSSAARQLGVSQSTVSRRLAALEQRLDRSLFSRSESGLTPTALALELAETAQRMEEAAQAANGRLEGNDAPIRIASCEVLAKCFLVPMLGAWRSARGGTGELIVYDSLYDLADDSFDLLMTPRESAPEEMTGRRIASMSWSAYASPDYLAAHGRPEKGASLDGRDVIRSADPLARIEACRGFESLGGSVCFTASNLLSQLEAAASGQGIAFLPDPLVGSDPRLVRLDIGDFSPTEVWLVARKAATGLPRVSAFLKWARGYLAGGTAARDRLARVA